MALLPLPTGFYEDKSKPISVQNCVNFYLNLVQTEGALNRATLYGAHGLSQLATSGATAEQINRGAHVFGNVPYYVNGSSLYSLDRTLVGSTETFAMTEVGTISGSGRVSMASNESQLMILVPDGNGYIYDGTTLSTITDSDFTASGNPQLVYFIDGYFACNTDEKKWIISALNDGTNWNALQFGSAESDPDAITALAVVNNRIFAVGTQTCEGFENIGGFGFPFQREGTFLDKGTSSPFSVISSNRAFFMVGGGEFETPAIWMFKDNDFQKISTTPIDDLLASFSDTEIINCFAYSYSQAGAYFVGFTFPSITLEYNMINNKWNERSSYASESEGKWRVNSVVRAYNRVLCGDSADGRVGELSPDTYGEYGEDIHSYFTTQPFSKDSDPLTVPRLELTMEAGVGNSTVTDPKVGFSNSRDSQTFNYERVRPIGKEGEYDRRAVWFQNGRFSRYVSFRFRITDQVKKVVIKLEAK